MSGFTINNGEINKIGIWTGDVIEFAGVRYRITKINPKNYKMMRETDGRTFNLAKDAYGIKKSDNQEWSGPKEKTPYEKHVAAMDAGLMLGTIVALTDDRLVNKYSNKESWVIIAKAGDGTMRLTKLGGWSDRYLRGITADQVEVISG